MSTRVSIKFSDLFVNYAVMDDKCRYDSSGLHHHRAEHWVVVKGTALITNGDQEILLSENQSTYIPIGVVRRLALFHKMLASLTLN